jgi:O-antigen/teichoic acid export membrane protein
VKDQQLLKHAIIIFTASVLANLFNYLYQLYMGRTLGPESYGALGSLFAIIYIISVVNGTLTYVISRAVTGSRANGDFSRIKSLIISVLRDTALIGLIGFGFFALCSGFVASFLKIDSFIPVIIVAIYGFLTLLNPTFNGVLNGLQRFGWSGFINVMTSLVKLLFGILLVYLGYGVNGALAAMIISSLIVLLLFYIALSDIFKAKVVEIKKLNLRNDIGPAFFGRAIPMAAINVDILLVKHYFTGVEAGYYVASSMIAKLIVFFSGSLADVMFPKVADMDAKGEGSSSILKKTILYTAAISLVAILGFILVPNLIIGLLYGPEYKISNLLLPLGVAMAFYSLSNVIILYQIALNQRGFVKMLIVALAIEILVILGFHNSLVLIAAIMLSINVALFALLLITFKRERDKDVQAVSHNAGL